MWRSILRNGGFLSLVTLAFCSETKAQPDVASVPEIKQIIIVTNGSSPFWDEVVVGVQQASSDSLQNPRQYQAVVHRNDFTVQKQIAILQRLANAENVAAVAVSVIDPDSPAIVEVMAKLQEQGVKVITIDQDVAPKFRKKCRVAFVGCDQKQCGTQLGLAVQALSKKPVRYGVCTFLKDSLTSKQRIAGFQAGIGKESQLVETLEDQGRPDRAAENVSQLLLKHDNLQLLMGVAEYHTRRICGELQRQNRSEMTRVAGFDIAPWSAELLKSGDVDVICHSNPYMTGYQAWRLLQALADDNQKQVQELLPNLGKPNGELLSVPPQLVFRNDVKLPDKKLFDANTQLFHIKDFVQLPWQKQLHPNKSR